MYLRRIMRAVPFSYRCSSGVRYDRLATSFQNNPTVAIHTAVLHAVQYRNIDCKISARYPLFGGLLSVPVRVLTTQATEQVLVVYGHYQ